MIIPWTVESSRIIHADRWISLKADRVRTGKGVVLDPYYVLSYSDWTCVVAITPDEQVVLVRQYRHGTQQVVLELPSGHVDPADPTPAHGGARELLEETGYGSDDVVYLGAYAANPARQSNYMHVVLVRNAVRLCEPALEAGEELEMEMMSLEDAVAAALDGRMSQSMHVAALFLAREAFRRA